MINKILGAYNRILHTLRLRRPYNELGPLEYLMRMGGKGHASDRRYRYPEDVHHFNRTEVLRRTVYLGKSIYFFCNPHSVIERVILEKGLFDKPVLELMSDFTDNDSVLVDVGANIGAHAIPLAILQPGTEIHAFEPNPATLERLKRNIAINRCTNIEIHESGLSDHAGQATLYAVRQESAGRFDPGMSSTVPSAVSGESTNSVDIRLDTLDSIFSETGKRISFIKIDVQGAELKVLQGARKTVERHRPHILFEFEEALFPSEEEANDARKGLRALMEEWNYEVYYLNVRYSSDMLAPVNWQAASNCNLLAIPGIPRGPVTGA